MYKNITLSLMAIALLGCGSSSTNDSPTNESTTPDGNQPQVQEVTETNLVSFKGLEYEKIVSPYTGKIWLDRNLGASQVCIAMDDTECFGDYYQWGRAADGHEKSLNAVSQNLATDVSNSGTNGFIITGNQTPNDWASVDSDGSLRSANWSKTDGSVICPTGFRVPTIQEINDETQDVTNQVTAFENFLKLPSSGFADASDGRKLFVEQYGTIWSSSVDNVNSKHFGYYDKNVQRDGTPRAGGFGVRCIMD
jgi:uncharacterized protein (TIGR02145 family)